MSTTPSKPRLRPRAGSETTPRHQSPSPTPTTTRPRANSGTTRNEGIPPKPSPQRSKPAWNSPAVKRTATQPTISRPTSAGGTSTRPPSGRPTQPTPVRSTLTKPPSTTSLRTQYETLLTTKNPTDNALRDSLRKLRRLILTEGLPPDSSDTTSKSECSLRGRVWKVLLGIYRLSSFEYLNLVERGPSKFYDKIKNDTFRTCATDRKFLAKVDEGMLSRVLNAFVWKMEDIPRSRLLNLSFSYVQGMNVLAAPFLYVMPELDAFYTFTAFIQHACPLYVQPALEGVHCGLKLLDKCMQVCDPQLYRNLKSKGLTASIYAFPSVMTFSACTPPLTSVLTLWDFLLAYGPHLNILCIISQLLLVRSQIMKSQSPMKILRQFPELNAQEVIQKTLGLVPRLPEDLYDMLVRHPFDATVYELVMGDEGVGEVGAGLWWGGEEEDGEDV